MTTEILAVVDNVARLRRQTMQPCLLNELRAALTRDNPQWHYMNRMRSKNPHKFRYANMPPQTIISYQEDDQTVYIPRGYLGEFKEMAARYDQTVKVFDETTVFDRDPAVELRGLQARTYQQRATTNMVMARNGVTVAPCGAGKTVMGAMLIGLVKQPTLVMAHTGDLVTQWVGEISKFLTVDNVGQFGLGIKKVGYVTVATVQTLVRMERDELVLFMSQFGCLILDECHHCPAETFLNLVNMSPARYRFGLTATPDRQDKLEFLMTDVFGPIVDEVLDADLHASGSYLGCEVKEVYTSFWSEMKGDQWVALQSQLAKDTERNNLIVSNVKASWEQGHFPLVICERVAHCSHLTELLRAQGMNAQCLAGSVPAAARRGIVADSRKGLVDALVATKVADEGLDIPNLSAIHLAAPTDNESKTKQRIGRIRRPVEDKLSPVVYDYIDTRVATLQRKAKARMRLYKRWGFVQ